jgi:uncharacterized membrane protein
MSGKKKKSTPNRNVLKKNAASEFPRDKRAAKKAAVLGTARNRRPPAYALLCIAVLVVTCAGYLYLSRGENDSISAPVSASTDGTRIIFPVNIFEDGKARHYEYKSDDFTVRYFIIKSSDGVIRAAFDACDVCWPAGKGYYQAGDNMICRNCGRRFASVRVNEVKGGCNPAPLDRTVENGNLIIQVEDMLTGKRFFNFSGKV